MKTVKLSFILIFSVILGAYTQTNTQAPWISYPTANVHQYGVYHLRKSVNFDAVPEKLMIHVSADNRYHLYVNGKSVCYGPAKGDLQTWKYDVVDIAPYLKTGKNTLAALFYNAGDDKPMAVISAQTAFFLRSDDERYSFLNTDESWKIYKNPAYDQITYAELKTWEWVKGYYACGGNDEVLAEKYPYGWESVDFDDSNWQQPQVLRFDKSPPWNLVPRNIAFMDRYIEKPAKIRRVQQVSGIEGFISGNSRIKIDANTKASVLFDFGIFTMGYPELLVNKGKNSKITIKYAEALYEKPNLKTHRDSVKGKTMYGLFDIFHPDGEQRKFRPIWKRAFRYVMLEIETQDQPLEIISLQNEYSGYPYPQMANFSCDDERLNKIFNMCLQTLRMCSGETYYDTPFYEQLSYGGDNRPIAVNSIYNSTDDRLLREMLRIYPQSVNHETGLFKSAYPSRFDFDMGSWSLAWIQALNDYYYLRGDTVFVQQFIKDIEGVLTFYQQHIDESVQMLGSITGRNFIDWSHNFGSLPQRKPRIALTHSAMLTLYYIHTLDCTVDLYKEFGENEKAKKWKEIAQQLRTGVYNQCWNQDKQLFADYPGSEDFSHQTNILAILCDMIPPAQQSDLLNRILTYDDFYEIASSYFEFFLFKAMHKTQNEELFLKNLDFWHTYLDRGHTTCGETGFAVHDRSDCHAWSAHPSYYLLSFVCGIQPADTGFNHVIIKPHPGHLKSIQADMPHPKGRIKVNYEIKKNKIKAVIVLPTDMNGKFEYKGEEINLKPGENKFQI